MHLTASGFYVVGQVPAGFTWLVKTIHLLNGGSGSMTVTMQMFSADGGAAATLLSETIEAAGFKTLELWTAMDQADQLVANASLGGLYLWVSGAELPGVVPSRTFTPRPK